MNVFNRPTAAVLRLSLLFAALAVATPTAAAAPYAWGPKSREALAQRFPPPAGFRRVPVDDKSFGTWLRGLPLLPPSAKVKTFDGRVVDADAAAVVDIDIGTRDLQQCADFVIRMRAEFLFANQRQDEISFRFTSGDASSFSSWRRGVRPKVRKSGVQFVRSAKPDASYRSFRSYLKNLFIFAGTSSLERDTPKLARGATAKDIAPGMFFVRGGFPGHAILVLDVVEDTQGHRRLLLGQGYMPAQNFHVVRGATGAWFPFDDGTTQVRVPTWPEPFTLASIRTFESR